MVIKIKKTTALFLLIAVLLGCTVVFFSCWVGKARRHEKETIEPPVDSGTVTVDPTPVGEDSADPRIVGGERQEISWRDFQERLSDAYFKDETVRFLVCSNDYFDSLCARSIAPEDDTSFSVNNAVLERNKILASTLGVKVAMDVKSTEDFGSEMLTVKTTGIHHYDVVSNNSSSNFSAAFLGDCKGSLLDLNSIDPAENYLDLDAPYWDKALYDAASYNGHAYWITGELSQSYIGGMHAFFVNKTLWDENEELIAALPSAKGESNLYALYNKGLWTLDLVCEISNAIYLDADNDGKLSYEDRYGYADYGYGTDVLAAGAGVRSLEKKGETLYESSFNSNRSRFFAAKLIKLYTDSRALNLNFNSGMEEVIDRFSKGNVLMIGHTLSEAEGYLNIMEDGYVIMPPPMLSPNDPTGYVTGLWNNFSMYAIAATAKTEGRVQLITATLEYMACLSYLNVTPVYFEELMLGINQNATSKAKDNQVRILNALVDHCQPDSGMLWYQHLNDPMRLFRTVSTSRNLPELMAEADNELRACLQTLLEELSNAEKLLDDV